MLIMRYCLGNTGRSVTDRSNQMEYFLMAAAVLFSVSSNMILHGFKNRSFKTPGDVFLFNAGISCIWFIVLLSWSVLSGDFIISSGSIMYGVIYGVILCLFLYFKTQSMSSGPVALTSLIGNCAFIIATWFGVVYANETVVPLQLVGMVIIVIALVMCINPWKSSQKLTPGWFVWCGAFFLAGGLLGMFNKVFGKSEFSQEINAMMLVASLVSAALFTLSGFLINKTTHHQKPQIYKESLIYIATCGFVGCIYIRMNLWLAGVIPSVVFFPVSNGANVLLSTLFGQMLFREKLNKMELIGIFVGLGAILLIGCPQLFV